MSKRQQNPRPLRSEQSMRDTPLTSEDNAWRDDAACAQVDPEMWHPEKGSTWVAREAIRICRRTCPVREACLIHALRTRERTAIYGGFTETGRKAFHQMVDHGASPHDVAIVALHGEEVLTAWSA